MNKNLYRIVFNKARGLLMAVAEIASSQGKGDSPASGSVSTRSRGISVQFAKMHVLSFAAKIATGALVLVMPLANAQVVVDRSAPASQQPTLLRTANGTTQIDIRTPSAAGVSRNTYSQLDVNAAGVVLNNSRTNVQTQIGGWVAGNPWLATGSARVILNEVNSSNPTQLQGYVEVAGGRAQVIIANPAGVTCDGCGFINADRTTLTTGTPIINGGNLDGYVVRQGVVTVQGGGLDTSQSTYTDIIARGVQINAGIWSNDLKVTAGANNVSASNTQAIPIAGQGSTPSFAIDVAQLGGMYANKITLVGTEAGLGVRNAGQIGASAGSVVITADGKIENRGQVASGTQLALNTASDVVNTGSIFSGGELNAQVQGDIVNTTGVIAANQGLSLNARSIDNTNGTIGSLQSNITIDTGNGSLSNAHGYIEGAQRVQISSTGIDNSDGSILGGQIAVDSKTDAFKNTRGVLFAKGQTDGTLNVVGTALDNESGVIQSADNLSINVGSGSANNKQGLIASDKVVSIAAAEVMNQTTTSAGQGIQGKAIAIDTNVLNNTDGAILADESVTLTSSGSIDNTRGLISSIKQIDVKNTPTSAPKSLLVANTDGTIIAGTTLSLDSKKLSGDGKVLSSGDLSVKVTDDFTNIGGFQANGTASLESDGAIVNQAKMASGTSLAVKAASIDNQAGGEISANALTLNATDAHTLTNRGLIDGGDTVINTVTLNNIGTGRIYGDHLAIGATTVLNDAETINGVTNTATIASRGRLDIGATTITNREGATIYSGSDMSIGGQLDQNNLATGQATLLENKSANIEATDNLFLAAKTINNTNEHFSTAVKVVSSNAFSIYQGSGSPNQYAPGPAYEYKDETIHLHTPDGNYETWSRYDITRTVTETDIVESKPSVISAGKQISFLADTVLNDKSTIIAGGDIVGAIGTLSNTVVNGVNTTTDSGTVSNYSRKRRKGTDSTRVQTSGYNPAPTVQTIALNATTYQSNVTPEASATAVTDLAVRTVNQNGQGANATGAATLVRTGTVKTTVSNSSLFAIATAPSSTYFIETDPRFASYKTWLSSDYFLQRLNLDPTTTQKRLGDGFYEQKLVREQVAQLTGRRFLDGYASDEAEYKALIDNAVTVASALDLRPGIALTAAQMAALTSDIVWLVEKDVTLPNGQVTKALVPQVYVRVQDGDLSPSGSLIAGSNVNLNLTGDLVNAGTIAGRNVVSLTAENIQNLGGRIAGNSTALQARTDINNFGGTIQGNDSLVALAGRDVNVASTSSTQTTRQGSNTNIDRVAGLYVSNPNGTLIASADRDVNLNAAQISNAGTNGVTTIAAGNNINLGTVTEARDQSVVWDAKNSRKDTSSRQVGSSIAGQGDIQLIANNDINVRGANVSSDQGALTVSANNVNLSASTSTQTLDEAHQFKSKGFMSSKKITTRDTLDATTSNATTLSGQTVAVQANNDINLKGANIVSTLGSTLVAGNNLTIEAAVDTRIEEHTKNVKKSGLASSSKNNLSTVTVDTQAVGSSVSANTIALGATQDVAIIGSHLNATGDTVISAGRDVLISAATETHSVSQVSEVKKSGFSASFQSGVSVGSSKGKQTLDQNNTSAANASVSGSNVQLTATRDVGVLGSNVLADHDIGINAGRNINIDVAEQTETTVSTNKNSSSTMGLHPSLSGSMTIYGTTADKQNGQANGQSSITSLLSANDGNLSLVAGSTGTQESAITTRGADLLAGKAITLEADRVDLLASHDTTNSTNHSESKSFTIGAKPAGVIGGLINSAVESAMGAANGTGNDRLDNAMALKSGYDTYKLISKVQGLADGTEKLAKLASNDDPSGAAFGISVSVGSAKSSTDSRSASDSVSGTNLQAESIDITARKTDIHAEGAKIQATDINFAAARDVILEAAANTSMTQSKNSSSSASVGATIGIGQQTGISFQLGVQQGKGKANGDETTYDNTLVTATDKLTVKSGNDMTLSGAQLAGKQVSLDVGNDLTIKTLQDSSRYKSEQKSGGFGISLCIPPICVGSSSVSINLAEQAIKHNYQSAQGQSGIAAGDGGFDIKVGKVTDLVAAAITSSAESSKNHLSTGELVSSDLTNVQDTSAKSSSFSGSVSFGGNASLGSNLKQLGNDTALNLAGNAAASKELPKNESQQSQTVSVISPASITITGTDPSKNEQSQQTADLLTSRDPATANNALSNTLTLQQTAELEKEMKKAVQADQAARLLGQVGQQLSKDVGDYAGKKRDVLLNDAKNESDPDKKASLLNEAKNWDEGGAYRVGLHSLVGGLTGGASGALGASVSAAIIPDLAKMVRDLDLPVETKQAFIALAGAAVGGVVGGSQGASAGLNQTVNNFLGHVDKAERDRLLAKQKTAEGLTVDEARRLVFLQASDQLSDGLLAKATSGQALTAAEKADLQFYLGQYAVQDGSNATNALIKNGPTPSYSFPFAGASKTREAYIDKLTDGSLLNLVLLNRTQSADEKSFYEARIQAGLYLNTVPNEAFLPSQIKNQQMFADIDAIRNSSLAGATYLGATAAGVDPDKRSAATQMASVFSDIGASFILPRTSVSPALGQTSVSPVNSTVTIKNGSVEISLEYKPLVGKEAEFSRQLQLQQDALSNMTAGEIKANIEDYRANGRPSEASAAAAAYRRDNPPTQPGQAALHNPDCCIGGSPQNVTDYGDSRVNSSIGSQNKNLQDTIYNAVKDLPADSKVRFKLNTQG